MKVHKEEVGFGLTFYGWMGVSNRKNGVMSHLNGLYKPKTYHIKYHKWAKFLKLISRDTVFMFTGFQT